MNRDQVRAIVREHGPQGFADMLGRTLKGEKLPNGATLKKSARDFSIREIFEACVGSVHETFDNPAWQREAGALDPTGFPSATEKLLSTVMIEGYEAQAGVADRLVPQTKRPATETERIIGFTTLDTSKPILTGEEYPTVGFGEKYVTFEEAIHQKKEGYEIQVTEEVVRFDQSGMIMDRAMQIGMTLQSERERRTVRAVLGIGADSGTTQNGVYFPSGVDTALYSSGNSNLRTDASALVGANSQLRDYTDLQEALTAHATLVFDDRQVGSQRPIVWNPNTMLVPVSLQVVAGNIFSSVGQVYITNTGSSPEIRNNAPSPINAMFGNGVPSMVSSVYVDEVSTTAWLLYDNQRTFVRIEVFPFQTFRSPVGYGWNRDLLMSMRAREWSRVIARDNRTTQKSNGA